MAGVGQMINRQLKIIVFAIASLVTAFGVYCVIVSCLLFMQFREWRKARLLDIEVDVSQPGEFSGQFVPKCPIAVFCVLLLELHPSFSDEAETEALLEGMEARLSIMDSHGSELPNLKYRPVKQITRENPIMLECLQNLPEETHTLKLTISKGAEALSGTKQQLFLEYRFGFQAISLHITFLAAVISLILGVGLTIYGLTLTKKENAGRCGVSP